MAKKKKKEVETGRILGRLNDDGSITPFIQKQQEEDIAPVKDTWLKKGALNDSGYAIQNPLDAINRFNASILMTGVDALGQFGRGYLGSAEGVTDIAKTTTADVLDFFGANNKAKKLRESAEKQWGVNEELEKSVASDNGFGIDDMSFLGTKGKSIPQGLASTAFSLTTGTVLGGPAGMAMLGLSAAGNAEQEAIKEMKAYQDVNGFSDKEIYKNAKLYGVLSGTAEALTEMMFGAAAKGSKLLGIGTGVFDEADDAVINALTKRIHNNLIKTFTQAGLKATSEGFEEVASGLLDAFAKKITYQKDKKYWDELVKDENLLDSFLSGTFSAALSQAPGVAKHITTVDENGKLRLKSNNEIKDYITDLSTNEQKIADKVAESRFTEEMTNKEKSKIRREVMDQLRNLELTSDEINKSLGDEVIQGEPADTLLHQIIQNENTKFNFDEAELQVDNKRVNKNATNVEAKIQQLANDFTNELNDIRNTTSAHKLFNEMKNVIQATGEQVRLTSYNELEKQGAVKLLTDEKGNPIRNKNGRLQYTDEKGNLIGINGFRSKDGIVLNSDSTRLFEATMGHEIGESIKANSQNDYKVLREIATELGKLDGTLTDETMKAIERTYGTLGERTDSYLDEYVNDKLGELFTKDSDLINRIGQKPTILRKIIDEVKYLVKRFTTKSEEGKKLLELQHNLENKLQESIRELNVNNKTQQGTQYQLDNQDEKIITTKNGERIEYNNYYEYAKDITKNNDELAKELLFKHYSQNFDVPANSNEKKFYHGTDATFDYDGLKVMDFDEQTMDRNYGDYFYITTDKGFSHTYGSQIAEFIIPNDKILSLEDYRKNYSDKTDDELFNDYWALEMPDDEYIVKDIKPIIDYSKQRANEYINQQENKTKYSITDNQGRELSKEQQEYFKNSKVRDEDGRLIEVYHGSPNEFTVFDKGKMKTGATMYASSGDGFYFTDSEAKADKYSKGGTKYSTYLNITNPFVVENKISNEAADLLYKFSQQVIENHPEATQKDIGAYELFDRNDIGQRSGTAILSNVVTEYGDEFTEFLKENGYDGIKSSVTDYDNVGEQYNYVAFESNQIKNVDNTNPTSNPDIRYSLSEDAETFKTPYGVEVVKNPSTDDYIQMRQDILEEYPWLRGEKILRQTYDEEGNVYYWNAYDAQHADVEPYINKKYNTRTFQNDGWWKNPIYKDSPKDYSYVDTSNFKYSLSEAPKQDNQGRELTKNQQEFYKNVSPEVRDENGNLMSFYHGSNSEFTIFDITKSGESSKEAKVGFWFTPNKKGAENFANEVWYGDKTPTTYEVYLNIKNPKVYETYEVDQQQRDNMIQNRKNIEQEIRDSSHKYSWTETGDYKVTSLYNDLVEMNRREKNGIKFKEDAQYNEEFYRKLAEERNISNEKFDEMNQDAKSQVELETQKRKADDEFYSYVYSDAYEQFKTDLYLSAGMRAEDANVGGMGMMMKNENEAVANFVEGLKQEGYDGIVIKNTHYDNDSLGEGKNNNQYVAFYPNQIKNVTNENPTENDDIRYQLGNNEVAPIGNGIRSEQIKPQDIQEAIAPLQEQVQQLNDTITRLEDRIAPLNEQEADELYQETQRGFENEVAPIRENLTPEENQRMDMLELLERNNMMNDERRYEKEQLENKINPVYPTEEATPGQALSDIRDIDEVGKRDVKAYQYEHPEVKPYFQEEAKGMLNDLNNSIKGERFINESQQRGQGTSYDVLGVKRFTSPEIAELLDSKYGYTYDDIRKGLNAIIEDHGAENIAIAKRIELVLDDNLRNGYTDWQTGMEIPPNQEYLNMLAEQEWQNYFDDINSQYPLDVNQVQYALEQERQQEEQYKIEKTLEEMTADDINLEPFLSGLQGASERQAERQQLREELNQKKEIKIPKQSDSRKAVNRGLGLLVNEFAVLDDYSKQTGNKDIKFKTDTYNNYQAIAQSNIETAQTDINGKAIGRSGSSIFEEAKKLGLEKTFDEYLKQWANVDRAKQGKGVANYSAKESYKIVKEMEAKYPALKRLGNDMWQYYRNVRHNLRDAGIINQDVSDMLGRMYPHYTPYISENIENYFTDEGKLKPKATIKRAKGGASIGSLLSAEEAMQRYTKSEFNTIFGNDLYREIVNTSNDIVQLGGDDRGMQFVNADNLYADKNGYYLTAYENGEPITTRISEDMYRTLTRESRNRISDIENTFSVVTKPLQGLSKLRRNILTSWSPTFIAKNFIKDFQEGIFNSKYTKDFIKNYPSAFKELATNTELAQQFKSLYGSGLTMGQYDIDANNYNPSGKNRNFLKGIKNANELIELAPRYAEFKASIDHGASLQEAMYNAREVTTNFSRGGTLAKALNRNGFTFLNSSIQGFDKFIRNFSGENGAKGIVNSLAKAAIFGIAPAVFNELAFGSGDDKDEDYEALPDYIKDNYYIIKLGKNQGEYDDNGNVIKIGESTFLRIPKGRVLSVFGSAARRTIEAMEGEENAFEGYFNNVQQQIGINNPEENNIFAPLIQAMGGRKLDSGQTAGSAWYGGDIIPSRLQKERPEDQYDASIDKLSIWLGQRTGISPYKINYVLDQYTGGIGDLALPMITEEANSDGSVIAPIKDQFTADTITDNKYVSEFYDTKGKLYTGSKATDEDVLKNKYMNSISTEMAKLYAERRDIQADENLTKQQKYAKSQAIKAEINRLAKEGMDNYNDIIMSNNYAKIGDTEYYKNANGQWTKATDDVASLGLDTEEKNEYYKVKNDIYTTKKENDGNDKPLVMQDIINSNLTPDAKVNLYTSNYKDELIQPLVDSGMDVDSYLTYKSQNFTADKDSNGKSISGSKKQKVFDYINSMDVPYEQKLILAKSEYNSFNDNNAEIIEYIENTGMDYDERMELYKALGFKVDGDSISW